jgi:hypothetical protein
VLIFERSRRRGRRRRRNTKDVTARVTENVATDSENRKNKRNEARAEEGKGNKTKPRPAVVFACEETEGFSAALDRAASCFFVRLPANRGGKRRRLLRRIQRKKELDGLTRRSRRL